jgi:hypothetical protein
MVKRNVKYFIKILTGEQWSDLLDLLTMRCTIWMLLLGCAFPKAVIGSSWEWKETVTPHFRINHQETWLPQGLTIGAEKLHFRLGMDLGQFSPWMSKERISLYIYRDLDSYVNGEFSPPAWSNGVPKL